eukprot:ANDGO_01895.mRNA.1 hypothetical protein
MSSSEVSSSASSSAMTVPVTVPVTVQVRRPSSSSAPSSPVSDSYDPSSTNNLNASSSSASLSRQACANCRRAHKKCDEQRPCVRCLKLSLPMCCDDPPKKRGRPALSTAGLPVITLPFYGSPGAAGTQTSLITPMPQYMNMNINTNSIGVGMGMAQHHGHPQMSGMHSSAGAGTGAGAGSVSHPLHHGHMHGDGSRFFALPQTSGSATSGGANSSTSSGSATSFGSTAANGVASGTSMNSSGQNSTANGNAAGAAATGGIGSHGGAFYSHTAGSTAVQVPLSAHHSSIKMVDSSTLYGRQCYCRDEWDHWIEWNAPSFGFWECPFPAAVVSGPLSSVSNEEPAAEASAKDEDKNEAPKNAKGRVIKANEAFFSAVGVSSNPMLIDSIFLAVLTEEQTGNAENPASEAAASLASASLSAIPSSNVLSTSSSASTFGVNSTPNMLKRTGNSKLRIAVKLQGSPVTVSTSHAHIVVPRSSGIEVTEPVVVVYLTEQQ